MNYVPKHSRGRADSEMYRLWGYTVMEPSLPLTSIYKLYRLVQKKDSTSFSCWNYSSITHSRGLRPYIRASGTPLLIVVKLNWHGPMQPMSQFWRIGAGRRHTRAALTYQNVLRHRVECVRNVSRYTVASVHGPHTRRAVLMRTDSFTVGQ